MRTNDENGSSVIVISMLVFHFPHCDFLFDASLGLTNLSLTAFSCDAFKIRLVCTASEAFLKAVLPFSRGFALPET